MGQSTGIQADANSHDDGRLYFTPLYSHRIALSRPARPFEFPNGYNDMFGVERYRASEVVFSPILWEGVSGVVSSKPRHKT